MTSLTQAEADALSNVITLQGTPASIAATASNLTSGQVTGAALQAAGAIESWISVVGKEIPGAAQTVALGNVLNDVYVIYDKNQKGESLGANITNLAADLAAAAPIIIGMVASAEVTIPLVALFTARNQRYRSRIVFGSMN